MLTAAVGERGWVSSRSLVIVAGAALASGVLWLWVHRGGVQPSSQALPHGLFAVGLLACASSSARSIRRMHVVAPLAMAYVLLALPVVVSLLEVPRAWLDAVAPGRRYAFPTDAAAPLGLAGAAALREWGLLTLAWGGSMLAACACSRARVRSHLPMFAMVGALAAAFVGFTRVGELLFSGHIDAARDGRVFAPLVNPNHNASLLLGVLPVALSAWTLGKQKTFAAFVVVAIGASLVWISSVGVTAVAIVALLMGLRGHVRWAAIGGFAAAAGVAIVSAMGRLTGHLDTVGRQDMWTAGLQAWSDQPWMGVGAGAYDLAVGPYRSDQAFVAFYHAHSDVLQRFIETGVVGFLLAIGAIVVVVRSVRWQAQQGAFAFGALCIWLHAWVDFPLQIPVIAVVFAVFVGIATQPTSSRGSAWTRPVLILAALLQVVAALSAGRPLPENPAARALAEAKEHATAGQWERAEGALARARADAVSAVHLRDVARLYATMSMPEHAQEVAVAARNLGTWDYRNWVLEAQLATVRGEPAQAAAAWTQAFEHSAPQPLMQQAYEALPSALYWLDVMEDISPSHANHLGKVALRAGDLEVALLAFESALLQTGPDAQPHPEYGRALLRAGRLGEASAVAAQLAEQPVTLVRAHALKGEIAMVEGRFDAAVAHFEDAQAQDLGYRYLVIRAVSYAQGVDASVQRYDVWRLTGWEDTASELEIARALLRGRRYRACTARLVGSRHLEDAAWGERFRDLLAQCENGP